MNTRFYAAIFDDASFQLLDEIVRQPELRRAGRGWADVNMTMTLKREVPAGTMLCVHSEVTKLGTKSISCRHHLLSACRTTVHATADVVTVLFDLQERRAVVIEDTIRARAEALLRG